MVISMPSQSFFNVESVMLWFLPLTKLFTVDCVMPLTMLSRLIDSPFSRHSSKTRALTASPMVTGVTSFQVEDTRLHLKRLTHLGYYNGKGLDETCIDSDEGDGYGKDTIYTILLTPEFL